tara:strand:- start:341 stop:451 length:111 start_codon:yes stop_codon:yes gene_type:complete
MKKYLLIFVLRFFVGKRYCFESERDSKKEKMNSNKL